ncbi:MAG: CehA/McbA family metallohydrolase [Bryobacterales bacterium]|nr:CehA/McbA family metallohydrolase [Bryobacterales bacterium]
MSSTPLQSLRYSVICSVAAFVWTGLATAASVPLQPFAQQVRRLEDALSYIGQPLPMADHAAINRALALTDESQAVTKLQEILDQYVLVEVDINAESRVKVRQGKAKPELVEKGTRMFLVKVSNGAGVTAPLVVESPNSGPTSLRSRGEKEPAMELTQEHVKERWANLEMYHDPPMAPRLSGLGIEYQILQIYSRDHGQRSAKIAFNVGQGTQDIGFRNDILVLFNIEQARPITLRVRDEKGEPSIASFTIKDLQGRIYPNPSKRLAPDFPFQPQVYRADGEQVRLPDGYYSIEYGGGPEFYRRTKELPIEGNAPRELSFQLQRWIDPSKYGWWSGDHHVHASGCSHYKNPTEGVHPEDMIRQILGENLNIGAVLTWGPSWYYQKQFFSSKDHQLSKAERVMHYDVEVSGFPSSHAGHLVLLGLQEDDYPGTTRVDEWPSWDLPVLQWGQRQGAIVGFSHSGWGLQVKSDKLPNYEMPGFDGIGANEFIVDVTHDAVDFISTVDTPSVWELNIWYHTLNVGFRSRVSGETDFPCIYDDKVGLGRSYVKLDRLTYQGWIEGVRDGRCYVSEGKSHLMDFAVNGVEVGTNDSEVHLKGPQKVRVTAKTAAFLDRYPDPTFFDLGYAEKPYWDVERARVPNTREVPVELIVNGEAVASQNLLADGQVREMVFDVSIDKSSWIALRILPSSHTNPIFALVDGKPIRASRRSAEWCLAAVSQCWSQKAPRIRDSEKDAAQKAYDHAREVYRQRVRESSL